jgi:hypothetical protein
MAKSNIFLGGIISVILLVSAFCRFAYAEINIKDFVTNMEKNDKQSVLVGNIDSLTIARGNGEFNLGKGKLTLFDFGTGRVMAMVFEGNGRFVYTPPDEVERGQLQRFIKKDTLESMFSSATIFLAKETIDTNGFIRGPIDKKVWTCIQNTEKGILQNLNMYIPGALYSNTSFSGGSEFICADISDYANGELIYIAEPFADDFYSVYRVRPESKNKIAEKIGGYSAGKEISSQIDIEKYQIDIEVGGGGKVEGVCKIKFKSETDSLKFIPFRWSPKNIVKSVKYSSSRALSFIGKEGWDGFGVALNKMMNKGDIDSIDIEFSGKPFYSEWGVNYCDTVYSWYPENVVLDKATFALSIAVPSENAALSNNGLLNREANGYSDSSIYNFYENTSCLSLCYGSIMSSGFKSKSKINGCYVIPRLKGWHNDLYLDGNNEILIALMNAAGELATINDWFQQSEDEIYPDLIYLNKLIGYNPIDTIFLLETPFNHSKGSIGLVSLTTFMEDSTRLRDYFLRVHEVAHLWWGNCIQPKSYRDEWITEGLAEYCAYLSFKNANPDTAKEDTILNRWRNKILANSENGPVILGNRLRPNVVDTTGDYLISKSAYIFHMIRFLLKDYTSNSNDQFIAFIRDLALKYRDNEISTADLQKLLEQHTHRSMKWFFNQWVYGTGIPSYTFSYAVDSTAEKNYQVVCKIHQSGVPDRFMMQIPITVVYESGAMVHFPCVVSDPDQEISLPLIPARSKEVLFNTFDAVLSRD